MYQQALKYTSLNGSLHKAHMEKGHIEASIARIIWLIELSSTSYYTNSL